MGTGCVIPSVGAMTPAAVADIGRGMMAGHRLTGGDDPRAGGRRAARSRPQSRPASPSEAAIGGVRLPARVRSLSVLVIDGSQGEGGGQILRTALALSLVTGTPFRVERVRAGRAKPGLLRQHLTAVTAAVEIGGAQADGVALGARELTFRPGRVRPGAYRFAVGTAGSAGLVLQTVLPPLLTAAGPSTLVLEGGTHNPHAPPFDFLALAFLPLLGRMGARVRATLDRPGFYPAGGGQLTVEITPAPALQPLTLLERGETRRRRARAVVANLPADIARRELRVVRDRLGWSPDELEAVTLGARDGARGPGNVVLLELESEHVTEVFTGFGELGVRAEAVAEHAVQEARQYLAARVPVGPYLADQLLVPLALAGSGAFRTVPLTRHGTTNLAVIRQFTGAEFTVARAESGLSVTVELAPAA
jgi:RNA 3'-terminal phosphate cyclase (ATP)